MAVRVPGDVGVGTLEMEKQSSHSALWFSLGRKLSQTFLCDICPKSFPSLYTLLGLAHPLTLLVNQDNFMIPSATPWPEHFHPCQHQRLVSAQAHENEQTEPMWNRHSLDGHVGPSLTASLPLIAQHIKSRLELSFAQGYPDIFIRALNKTPVSFKILIAKLCLHKHIYFS